MSNPSSFVVSLILIVFPLSVGAIFPFPPNFDSGYRNGRAWVYINGDGQADFCRVIGPDELGGMLAYCPAEHRYRLSAHEGGFHWQAWGEWRPEDPTFAKRVSTVLLIRSDGGVQPFS